jgi:hypothetical protein
MAVCYITDIMVSEEDKNKARSVYDIERESVIDGDAICNAWNLFSRQKNKEQMCRVAREELAFILSLFDLVIIGKNDFRKWMQDVSHASLTSSGVVSLLKEIKSTNTTFLAHLSHTALVTRSPGR